MKQSTFSAVMANSIKNLLQGYTKGIRFTAILTLLFTVGIGQMLGATIFNCGIEINETWYKGTGTINSGNWLSGKTAFNNCDLGVITSLKLGGQYDTWDNNQTDACSWNANNGIWITISTTGGTQKDNFKLSSYHSGKDGNNNVWKTTGTKGSCGDKSTFGRYTHSISGYAPGTYKMKASWTSPSSESTQATASFTIPGFTTTSVSQVFDAITVGSSNSKTISFGTHYGTALNINNYAISGANASEFSVTGITENNITVKFTPTTAGNKSATLTITDAHGKVCTINLTGEVKCVVTWIVDKEKTTETVTHGSKVASAPTIDPNNLPCGDKFVGWTTSFYVHATDAPATLYSTAADIPAIEGDITFYAVFADYE